jgi:hypothetical protein
MARDLFDFHLAESTAGSSAIDDAVMGGVSSSRLRHDPAGHAVFEGVVSLDNNGGFASVRSRPGELGAPGAVSYVLDVRGDGKRYKLNLRTDDAFDGVNYQAAFEAPRDQWTTVRLPVSELRPTQNTPPGNSTLSNGKKPRAAGGRVGIGHASSPAETANQRQKFGWK